MKYSGVFFILMHMLIVIFQCEGAISENNVGQAVLKRSVIEGTQVRKLCYVLGVKEHYRTPEDNTKQSFPPTHYYEYEIKFVLGNSDADVNDSQRISEMKINKSHNNVNSQLLSVNTSIEKSTVAKVTWSYNDPTQALATYNPKKKKLVQITTYIDKINYGKEKIIMDTNQSVPILRNCKHYPLRKHARSEVNVTVHIKNRYTNEDAISIIIVKFKICFNKDTFTARWKIIMAAIVVGTVLLAFILVFIILYNSMCKNKCSRDESILKQTIQKDYMITDSTEMINKIPNSMKNNSFKFIGTKNTSKPTYTKVSEAWSKNNREVNPVNISPDWTYNDCVFENDINIPPATSSSVSFSKTTMARTNSYEVLGNYFKKKFTPNGGHVILRDCEVELIIPPGAIPNGSNINHVSLKVLPSSNLNDFAYLLKEKEKFITPIVECKYEETFAKHVCLKIKHCANFTHNALHIQYGDSRKGIAFKDADIMPNTNNIVSDIYYKIDSDYIWIYCTHFTQFVCSEHLISRAHEIDLLSMVFSKLSPHEHQEMSLKLFVLDKLQKLPVFKKELIESQKNLGSSLREERPIQCPSKMTKDSIWNVSLACDEDYWRCQSESDFPLKVTVKACRIISCHDTYSPYLLSEFVLVCPQGISRSSFHGTIRVEITPNLCGKLSKKKKILKNDDEEVIKTAIRITVRCRTGSYSSFNSRLKSSSSTFFETLNDVFVHVANNLPMNMYKKLAYELGITSVQCEDIEVRFPKNPFDQKLGLLETYHKSNSDFDMENLLCALENIGLQIIAGEICSYEICNEKLIRSATGPKRRACGRHLENRNRNCSSTL